MKSNPSSNITRFKWWQELKKSVKLRDGFCCRICGLKKNLVVSHIKSREFYPGLQKDINNCLTLCSFCDCRHGNDLERIKTLWMR